MAKSRSLRKHEVTYDQEKGCAVTNLPPEVLRNVYDHLDIPSRVTLSLTCKLFLEMSRHVDTGVTDLPSPVRMHMDCKHQSCIFTNHISNRRILMLMLKTWMPHGYSLCWICLKYSRTSSSKWKATTQVNLVGLNRIRLPAIDALNVRQVKCHSKCLDPNVLGVDVWCYPRIGTAGGFSEKFWRLHEPYMKDECEQFKIEYDAGMVCDS